MFKKYLNLCILTVLSTVMLTACSLFVDEQYVETKVPPDPMAIYQEKNKIYWEIKKDPTIINSKEITDKWFDNILDKSASDYLFYKQKYTTEVINLWNNRK